MNSINAHVCAHMDTRAASDIINRIIARAPLERTIISINQAPIINNASSGAILAVALISNKVTRTEYEIKSPLLFII